MTPPARMPVIFFGHGSPMNALERNRYTESWHALAVRSPKPKGIVFVSAHWYTRGTAVTAMDTPRTIHDFGGFPKALFDMRYPAPGSPGLAARVRAALAPVDVALDLSWGLDHGSWSVLVHAYPEADIPVVQLSIDATQPNAFHYAIGERLAPLRDEGFLIAASGNVVHNLSLMRRAADAAPLEWAVRFNDRIREALLAHDRDTLVNYTSLGEDARLSVPTPEHYLPLLYVVGAQRADEAMSIPIDGIELGSLSMLTAVAGV